MLISNASSESFAERQSHSPWAVGATLALVLLLTSWLNQHSLNRYLHQTYRSQPLESLQQQAWWQMGFQLRNLLWRGEQSALETLVQPTIKPSQEEQVVQFAPEPPQPEPHLEPEEQALKYEIDVLMYEFVARELSQIAFYDHNLQRPQVLKLSTANEEAKIVALKTTTPPPTETTAPEPQSALPAEASQTPEVPSIAPLSKGDKVVFMGDSMMQSLAPPIQRWLNQEHGISSTNLARHSTGLTNREYYDWPAEIERWLAEQNDPTIKLLVIQMGANDPWDIQEGKKTYKFQSADWEQVYGARIQRIIQAAHARNIRVVWLGFPIMRSAKYEKKIRYLNDFVLKTVTQNGGMAFAVQNLISPKGSYQDSIPIAGKTVRVRNKDGIHLSREGDAYLAEQLRSTIMP